MYSGDTVTLSMQSETERYQWESITLAVGSGLFDPVLEQNLCGMCVGETKEVSATDGTVLVTIQKVVNRVVPELTDALIAEAGMDGIQTMNEYINTLIEQQKQEKLEEVSYEAEQKILHEIFEKSEYLITYQDWRHAVEMQINRYAAIAESDGMKLQEMTAEDFEGKILVGSFFELVAMVQDSTWDYMREYLTGAYYADGLDQQVGEDGMKLSGGQKQRIAVTQMLLKHPDYLLMDEAASAIDIQGKDTVFEEIRSEMAGKTIVMVAHDGQTVRKADYVLVLDHGRITASGKLQELQQKNPFIQELMGEN